MSVDPLIAALCADATPTLSARGWEDLLAQARRASLVVRLAWRLADQGGLDAVPEAPRQHLLSALRVGDRLAVEMRLECERIRRALAAADLRCVLLKGTAYLSAGLPPARGRLFGDIDILVPQSDLAQAETALMAKGWIASDYDAYNQRYYRDWMHELPPLRHVIRGTTIDVHHTITPPTSSFSVDGARLLAAVLPVDADRKLWTLQPVDMVLHSAVHLFQEGEFDRGLRDLLDIDDLLRHFVAQELGFWPALVARARELGLQRPLHHALFHIERLFGTRVPAAERAAVTALQPPLPQRWLMAKLLTVALQPWHPTRHPRGEGLARWVLYVRSHWLRMPVHLLLPHLVRKAWRQRFPKKPATAAAP